MSEEFKIYSPLNTQSLLKFGKYKDEYVEDVFEKKIKYIDWLINQTGSTFYLKNHYTFSIKCGLTVPTLLLNEIKLEYFGSQNGKKRKVIAKYYNLYL